MATCRCGNSLNCKPGEAFLCKNCDIKFRCQDEYTDHMDIEHWRICEECLNVLKAGQKFNHHINQVHMYKCELCEVKFIKDSELKEHIHKSHRTKCNICNALLGDFVDLQSHKKRFHESELKTPAECLCGICKPEEITTCNHCSRIFKCVDEYVSHIGLQYKVTCEICSNMNPYGSLWRNEAQFYQH